MSRPLSIVHTESSMGWGGQELRVLSEARGLIGRGHTVRLLCPPGSRILAEAPAWQVPASALPIGKKRPVGLKCMVEWLKLNRCDVVSAHSSTDAWLAAVALLALGRPCPLVRTRHISAPVGRNALTRWLYTRATARIVTTGEALREQLIVENGYRGDRIESVPTGMDAARFSPGDRAAARARLGLPAQAMIAGIVATVRSWKNHLQLVEAVAGIPALHLVVVGEGPMREPVEAHAQRLGIRERTRFAGNQQDVLPWLHALDLFVLPSYANEGVPQALVQAMMTGLPSVTTHVGSIAEIALHEKTALVVPTKDVEALRAAIARLAADPALRARLGTAAREHVREAYSYERMLDRMERVYRLASGRY
jgi:glycosyltransferase involved in cell wall biosynthesis